MIINNKLCRRCLVTKPMTSFNKHKHMLDGYLNHCKSCNSSDAKLRYHKNRDKYKQVQDAWREANKERIQASRKKYKDKDRARHLKQKSEYAKKHRAQYNADTARYRAAKRKATRAYDEFDELFIKEIYDLSKLRSKLLGVIYHVDHIVPLVSDVVCGLHTYINLQILEGKLNMSKSNKVWPNMAGESI